MPSMAGFERAGRKRKKAIGVGRGQADSAAICRYFGLMLFSMTCALAIAFLGFDLWRMFDDNDVLGRPWPGRREANPSLWWTMVVVRAVTLIVFAWLGAVWGLSLLGTR